MAKEATAREHRLLVLGSSVSKGTAWGLIVFLLCCLCGLATGYAEDAASVALASVAWIVTFVVACRVRRMQAKVKGTAAILKGEMN